MGVGRTEDFAPRYAERLWKDQMKYFPELEDKGHVLHYLSKRHLH